MEIKVKEVAPIHIKLQQTPAISLGFETKYLRGGDFVSSKEVSNIVFLTTADYNNLVTSGKVDSKTLYLTYEE